ncbi:hypothetical protein AVEN_55864-1 [Araneus ventricosus]|uniref:Uncharacterized protein n=1 Tax=Araneus ventricosus TaxID=182803 RepID=A0A4Y2GTV6_ARAVE|nr:hypothetical protein AVEN_55864-1 [Araneus ventricosus]
MPALRGEKTGRILARNLRGVFTDSIFEAARVCHRPLGTNRGRGDPRKGNWRGCYTSAPPKAAVFAQVTDKGARAHQRQHQRGQRFVFAAPLRFNKSCHVARTVGNYTPLSVSVDIFAFRLESKQIAKGNAHSLKFPLGNSCDKSFFSRYRMN